MFRLRCLFSRIDRLNVIPMRSIGNSFNKIQYRAATADDLNPIVHLFQKQFLRDEPISSSEKRGLTRDEAEEYAMSNISHGASVVATDSLQNDKIIGFLLTGPINPDTAAEWEEEAKSWESKWKFWADTLKLFSYLEKQANIYERFNVTKSFHSHVGVVDSSARGKSISDGMGDKFEEIAKSFGYTVVSTDCTGVYSSRIAERRMPCVFELAYADYKDRNGKPIFNPPPPHTHIKKFAKFL